MRALDLPLPPPPPGGAAAAPTAPAAAAAGVRELFCGAWDSTGDLQEREGSLFWSLTLLRAGPLHRCFAANGIEPPDSATAKRTKSMQEQEEEEEEEELLSTGTLQLKTRVFACKHIDFTQTD